MRFIFITLLIFIIIFSSTAQENTPKYKLVSLGRKVNSNYHDSSPIVSSDGSTLYFTVTDHPQNNKGKEGSQDIWFAERDSTGSWSEAKHMGPPFNKNRYNQVMSVSGNGNTLLIRGGEGKNESGFSICKRVGQEWQKPQPLNIEDYGNMQQGMFSGAFLSQGSRVLLLYFSERKESKYSDLYVSFIQDNGNWSKPEPITCLNTKVDEFGPYLAPDGTSLYFASNRPGGMGSTDIYKTTRLDDTWQKWSTPENLGAPVNTSGFDAYYSIDASDTNVFTTRAYMSADGGNLDIYTLKPIEEVVPKISLSGVVYNQKNSQAVAATIRYEMAGETLGVINSDNMEGKYTTEIPCEGKVILRVSAEGFLNATDSIAIYDVTTDTEVIKNLFLKPIEVGLSVRLNNIFFDFDKATLRPESFPELDRVVELMEQNENLKIEIGGHTDDRGSDSYNLTLSQARAEAVRQYVVEHWITGDRVTAMGYGETTPEVDNESDENRQVNRRVEFTILEK